jgi:hypothetical protein
VVAQNVTVTYLQDLVARTSRALINCFTAQLDYICSLGRLTVQGHFEPGRPSPRHLAEGWCSPAWFMYPHLDEVPCSPGCAGLSCAGLLRRKHLFCSVQPCVVAQNVTATYLHDLIARTYRELTNCFTAQLDHIYSPDPPLRDPVIKSLDWGLVSKGPKRPPWAQGPTVLVYPCTAPRTPHSTGPDTSALGHLTRPP